MRMGRGLATALAVAALAIGATADLALHPAPAAAATGSDFRAGSIISDALFFDGRAMTAGDVEQFLQSRRPTCASGYTCLKDYSMATTSQPASAGLCDAYQGSASQTAAEIIAAVGRACGVSQKALLVTLQKEQGLVTAYAPTSSQYRTAMGYGCPDTAPCDALYYGFFNQVYRAARQFKLYALYPTSYSYRAGRLNQILFNPDATCSSSSVYIENQATAGLYNYTPYQPDAAALASLYGAGDGCSAYGNRNFWRDYTDWFGSTQTGANLVRTASDPTVYLVTFDHKFPVADLTTLDSLGPLGTVGYVDPSFLSSKTTGATLGRFIRDRAGIIYLFDRGWLFPVRDCTQLADWGASCSSYGDMALSDVQMSGFVKAGALSNTVMTPEGKRFAVYGGLKHEAADDTALQSSLVAGPPISLREAALGSLPYGAPLVHDGIVVRDRSTGADKLVDSGSAFDVAAGLTAGTVLRSLPLTYLDPSSTALMPRTGTVSGVVKGTTGAAYALGTSGLLQLGAGQLDQLKAAAPVLSAATLGAMGPATSGAVLARTPSVDTLYFMTASVKRAVTTLDDARWLSGGGTLRVALVAQVPLDGIPGGSPVITPGTLVKIDGADQIYLVDGATRLVPVPSFDITDALGLAGWQLVTSTQTTSYTVATAALGALVQCGGPTLVGLGGVVYPLVGSSVDTTGMPVSVLDPGTCAHLSISTAAINAPVFVRAPGDPALYLSSAGHRRPVTSMDTAYAVAAGARLVVAQVPAPALAAVPAGVPVLRPGSFVKSSSSPNIYLVDGIGGKVFASSFSVISAMGPGSWQDVPDATLAAYTAAPAELTSTVACANLRFVGSGGVMSPVPASVFDASGAPVTTVAWSTCRALPQGAPDAGPVFVKAPGADLVYEMDGGTRRPVTSMGRLLEITGGVMPAIGVVPGAVLSSLPLGAPA